MATRAVDGSILSAKKWWCLRDDCRRPDRRERHGRRVIDNDRIGILFVIGGAILLVLKIIRRKAVRSSDRMSEPISRQSVAVRLRALDRG